MALGEREGKAASDRSMRLSLVDRMFCESTPTNRPVEGDDLVRVIDFHRSPLTLIQQS
jgi:hypothetical protein